jgi:FeS assembly SUF system regulator
MIRMTKLTDYASVLMTYFARDTTLAHNARDLAAEARLPLPTVSKILKALSRGGLLVSHRGFNGGYTLARQPEEISLAEIIRSMEGPISITECGGDKVRRCPHEPLCPVRDNWQRINLIIRQALSNISLAEMTHPLSPQFEFSGPRLPMAAGAPGS